MHMRRVTFGGLADPKEHRHELTHAQNNEIVERGEKK